MPLAVAIISSAAAAGEFAKEVLKDLAADLVKESAKNIDRLEFYKKLKRKYFPGQTNNFSELYSGTLIELWYHKKNESLINLFKEPEIVVAIYKYKYELDTESYYEDLQDRIRQKYQALKDGDELKEANISADEAWITFDSYFQRVIRENTQLEQIEVIRLVENLSKNTELLKAEILNRNKSLKEKFKTQPENLTDLDVIRALCSGDPELSRGGTWFAIKLNVPEAAPIIKEQLQSHDPLLLSYSIEAASHFCLKDTAKYIEPLFTHPDLVVREIAKQYYFINIKQLTQRDLSKWLQWLHQSDTVIKQKVLKEFLTFAHKGMFDVASIQDDLMHEQTCIDEDVREYIYRLLFYSENLPETDKLKEWFDSETEPINKLCVARLLFLKNESTYVAEFLINELKSDENLAHKWNKLALLCNISSNPVCKQAWELFSATGPGEWLRSQINYNSLDKPILKPNAICKNHVDVERQALNQNANLIRFIKSVHPDSFFFTSDRRTAHFIIIDEENSLFTSDGLSEFLSTEFFYYTINYINKSDNQGQRLIDDYEKSNNLCIILPPDIPVYLENALNELYDSFKITMTDVNDIDKSVILNYDKNLIFLVSKKAYNTYRNENFFDRLQCGIPFNLPGENEFVNIYP